MEETILLSGILPESLVNGEGMRYVLFAQVCYHACPGCFNPHTHSPLGGKRFTLDELSQNILNHPLIEGVTFSGGDPFEQADKFATLAEILKQQGLNIWCYTGYTYETILQSLNEKVGWSKLLHTLDVLVDGPFDQASYDPNLKFRGSSNQRIIDVPKSLLSAHVVSYQFKS